MENVVVAEKVKLYNIPTKTARGENKMKIKRRKAGKEQSLVST